MATIAYDALAVALFLAILLLCFRVRPWLLDYHFNASGIEIVIFGGRVRLGRLARDRMRGVRIVPLADYTRLDRLAAFSLPNRFKTESVLVDTTYPIRLWSLTPADPHGSLDALGLTPGLDARKGV